MGHVVVAGCLMIEDGDGVVRHALHDFGGFEPESLEWWWDMAIGSAGRTVIDVGCYTGLYSIIAARAGAAVLAIEPLRANIVRACENFAINDVRERIQVVEAAASDRKGTALLTFNSNVPLTSGSSIAFRVPAHSRSINVSTLAIDGLKLDDVAAIKIDAERGEREVVAGALDTIARCQPSLLVETLDDVMRNEVLTLIPAYRVAATFDGRNTLYLPA